MPKPGGCHSSGISLGDVLRLPKRHPAWRRREAQSGSCTERENLAGDAKGKGASGSHREAESTDAPERGGQSWSLLGQAKDWEYRALAELETYFGSAAQSINAQLGIGIAA